MTRTVRLAIYRVLANKKARTIIITGLVSAIAAVGINLDPVMASDIAGVAISIVQAMDTGE